MNRTFLWAWLVAMVCGPAFVNEGEGALPARPGPHCEETAGEDDLFTPRRVLVLALQMDAPAVAALRTNSDNHAYVRCSFRGGGLSLTNVGIHCKGDSAGQLLEGRPDFTVTFDKFVRGQAFHGQKRLLLQSSREDPSYLSAPVAFALFRQAGVPAPRCGFARVQLNGRDLGLYVLIEGENRDFLRRHFGNDDGNLYDEGETHDVTGKLDKDHGGRKDDQSDVGALVAATRVTDPGERWRQLQKRLDMDRFLAFTAMEVLLWNEESYALGARQFRLYHDPATDRLVFFAKGVERVLTKTDGPALPQCKGVVARAVLTTPEGRRRYRQVVSRLLDTVFVPEKVESLSREIAAVIRPAAAEDGAEGGKAFDAAVARFCEAAARRARWLRDAPEAIDPP